jgi:hypothetical protein
MLRRKSSMASDKIVLYDIPCKGRCAAWSANTLKGSVPSHPARSWKIADSSVARLALNFKGVPYETTWIEYPDIAGFLGGKLSVCPATP